MTTTTAPNPADALRAAARDLYEALRELVDHTDPEDPTLLDRMRELSKGIGRRITNARKRAETAEPVQEKVSTPAAPAEPRRPPDSQPPPAPRSAELAAAAAVPAAKPRPVTVPIGPAPAPPPLPAGSPASLPSTAAHAGDNTTPRKRGRHRQPGAPRWVLALILLLVVGGVAISLTTGQPWTGIGTIISLPLVSLARRRAGAKHRRAEPRPSSEGR